ncbi:predicted protein [Lodderomyces elongisporus NRRL YB-4239]|uniref:Uncharacterized protein n=1 Tax=Lodderomyces elongisporus (strain ATCC 11503 / CBS 2605 / JCM 1781 / NBRC 1676 / NRRL YB-4239) TaxID=379508 RepID=A5E0V4_LODEL|nr:predicted protein [Lodderomyces elongisporus NRRL YB-4239]
MITSRHDDIHHDSQHGLFRQIEQRIKQGAQLQNLKLGNFLKVEETITTITAYEEDMETPVNLKKPTKPTKPTKFAKPEKPAKPTKPTKPEKLDTLEKNQKHGKPTPAQKPAKLSKPVLVGLATLKSTEDVKETPIKPEKPKLPQRLTLNQTLTLDKKLESAEVGKVDFDQKATQIHIQKPLQKPAPSVKPKPKSVKPPLVKAKPTVKQKHPILTDNTTSKSSPVQSRDITNSHLEPQKILEKTPEKVSEKPLLKNLISKLANNSSSDLSIESKLGSIYKSRTLPLAEELLINNVENSFQGKLGHLLKSRTFPSPKETNSRIGERFGKSMPLTFQDTTATTAGKSKVCDGPQPSVRHIRRAKGAKRKLPANLQKSGKALLQIDSVNSLLSPPRVLSTPVLVKSATIRQKITPQNLPNDSEKSRPPPPPIKLKPNLKPKPKPKPKVAPKPKEFDGKPLIKY